MSGNTRIKPAPTQSSLALLFAIRGFACTPTDKLVLFQLLSHANRGGGANPSMELIAHGIGMSARTVLRSILRLETKGVITIDRKQQFNRYQFHLRVLLAHQRPPVPKEASDDGDYMTPVSPNQLTPVSPNQLTPVSPNQEGQLTSVTTSTDISEQLTDTGDRVRCHPCHTKRIEEVKRITIEERPTDFVFSGSAPNALPAAEQVNEKDSGGRAPAPASPVEVSPADMQAVRQAVLSTFGTKARIQMIVAATPAMVALRRADRSTSEAALIYRAAVQRLVEDGTIGMEDGALIRREASDGNA